MGKGLLHLYVDQDLVGRAKVQGINLSKFFSDALRIRLNLMEEAVVDGEPLLQQIAKAEVEVSEKQRVLVVLQEKKQRMEKKEKDKIISSRVIEE